MERMLLARRFAHLTLVAVLALTAVFSSAAAYFAINHAGRAVSTAPPSVAPLEPVPDPSALPPGSYPTEPLAPGAPAPLLLADGWLNGEPQQPGDESSRLLVLDIWSDWCPACRQTAPGLMELHERFGDQVAFVSLTEIDESQVKTFVNEFKIPWPCGYGASLKSLSRFGAYTATRAPGIYNRGHEISPTLYVIGADGRVLWHDDQARPRHLKKSDALISDLAAELERLVGAG